MCHDGLEIIFAIGNIHSARGYFLLNHIHPILTKAKPGYLRQDREQNYSTKAVGIVTDKLKPLSGFVFTRIVP